MTLLTLLQNRSGGRGSAGSSIGGFSGGGSGIRTVQMKTVLQRAMEARAPKVKPQKERAARRAKAIEQQAARAVVAGATEQDLAPLMREWQAQRPSIAAQAAFYPAIDLFLSQVAFRIQQMGLLQDIDDEDAILALIL